MSITDKRETEALAALKLTLNHAQKELLEIILACEYLKGTSDEKRRAKRQQEQGK